MSKIEIRDSVVMGNVGGKPTKETEETEEIEDRIIYQDEETCNELIERIERLYTLKYSNWSNEEIDAFLGIPIEEMKEELEYYDDYLINVIIETCKSIEQDAAFEEKLKKHKPKKKKWWQI